MTRLCSIESCGNRHDSNGYCGKHNMMWKRHGDPLYVPVHVTKLCSVKNCNEKHSGKGFCVKHHYRFKKYGDPLYVPDPEQTKKKQSDSQKEWLEKNVNPMTGRKQSDKTKNKISESNKGRIPPNKGTKGIMKPNSGSFKEGHGKGIGKSKEHRRKISKALTGRIVSEDTKKKLSVANKGQIGYWKGKNLADETKKKISNANKGNPAWNKNKKQTDEHRRKNIESHKGIHPSDETRAKMSMMNSRPERKEKQREIWRKARHNQQKPNKPELKIKKILIDAGFVFNPEQNLNKFIKSSDESNFGMFINIPFSHPELQQNHKEVDFFIRPNKIIEHNGAYDHADNRKYKPDDLIRAHGDKIPAREIWTNEEFILDSLRKKGHEILVVWGLDLLNDFDKTKKKILKFARS